MDDADRPAAWSAVVMEQQAERRGAEVVIRVSPRVFSDALGLALRSRGVTIAECPMQDRRARPRAARRFDVAIVSEDLPGDVLAGRIILITPEGTALLLPGEGGDEPETGRRLADIDAVLDAVVG